MGKTAKPKQIKDEAGAVPMLLEYINKQNRPYNANDISANLHEAISKTVVVRALASMAERGELMEKVYGKQKIYFPLQSQYEKMSREDLNALDDVLDGLKKEISEVDRGCNEQQAVLNEILSLPTTEDAEKQLAELRAANDRRDAKLKDLRENGDRLTVVEKNNINKNYTSMLKEWRRRRRMATDILDQILENYPKPKATLYDDMGLCTDEESGVDIKDF